MTAPRGAGDGADRHDHLRIHCRRLGHPLGFGYCRTTGGEGPCPSIRDCWFERFDVTAYLEGHVPGRVLAALDEPPAPKLSTLVELIRGARERAARTEG